MHHHHHHLSLIRQIDKMQPYNAQMNGQIIKWWHIVDV